MVCRRPGFGWAIFPPTTRGATNCPASSARTLTCASTSPFHPKARNAKPQAAKHTPMIETRDLTKQYGDLFALNRLTLKLERGDVYGFIGPNGAGKTTTMRILATLL